MNERIAQLEKEILERQDAEAEQEERIAELLSSKSALEKQGEDIVRLADTCPGMTGLGQKRKSSGGHGNVHCWGKSRHNQAKSGPPASYVRCWG